jgi:hypothetical protein
VVQAVAELVAIANCYFLGLDYQAFVNAVCIRFTWVAHPDFYHCLGYKGDVTDWQARVHCLCVHRRFVSLSLSHPLSVCLCVFVCATMAGAARRACGSLLGF